MELEIITIGYEILEGDVLDTNSNWMAKEISATGNRLRRITVVEDDVGIVAQVLKASLSRSPSMILISGGLGPTRDDLTLEGVALGLGVRLHEEAEAMEMIAERYRRLHPETPPGEILTEPRKKMGRVPEGSEIVRNPVGAAPGVLIRRGGTRIICLPGVPDELKGMFAESIRPLLLGGRGRSFRSVLLEGMGESTLAPYLNEVMEGTGVEIRSYPSKGRIRLKILGERCGEAAGRLRELLPADVRVTDLDPGDP